MTGLSQRYAGSPVDTLIGLGLHVPARSTTAVLGTSGSGKSTLLRVIAGLLPVARGRVLVAGRDVTHAEPERRDVTLMFQKPHLFPHLSVLDNVAYPDRIRGRSRSLARRHAQELLDVVQLRDLATRRPHQLSGGQEQRVALARALAARPAVLLLDEPFSALDADLRLVMHQLVRDIRRTLAPTIIQVTHDVAEASRADAVAVLDGGRVVQHAPIGELYAAPATLAVARLLGGFNQLPHRRVVGGWESPLGPLLPGAVRDPEDTVVVIRQEHLEVAPLGSTGVCGRVSEVWWNGARRVVRIEVEAIGWRDPVTVRVEAALGQDCRVGDRVGVRASGPFVHVPNPHPRAR